MDTAGLRLEEWRKTLEQSGVKVDSIEVTVASHEFERNLEQGQSRRIFETLPFQSTRQSDLVGARLQDGLAIYPGSCSILVTEPRGNHLVSGLRHLNLGIVSWVITFLFQIAAFFLVCRKFPKEENPAV